MLKDLGKDDRGVLLGAVMAVLAFMYGIFHFLFMDLGLFMDFEFNQAATEMPLNISDVCILFFMMAIPVLLIWYCVRQNRLKLVCLEITVCLLLADCGVVYNVVVGLFLHRPEMLREVALPWRGMPQTASGILHCAVYMIAHLLIWFIILYNICGMVSRVFPGLKGRRRVAAFCGILMFGIAVIYFSGDVKQRADAVKYEKHAILRVATVHEDGSGEKECYGITPDKHYGGIKPFDSSDAVFYPMEYVGHTRNHFAGGKVYDEIYDENGTAIKPTKEMTRILELGEENEHWILNAWLIHADDLWFLQVMLNVNLWTPYELYWYNPKEDKLVEMAVFDGKQIVSLEVADRAYFERQMR